MDKREHTFLYAGCLGRPGSHSYEAFSTFFSQGSVAPLYYEQGADLLQDLSKGKIPYGVLPVGNSGTGNVTRLYRSLYEQNCHIIGEKYVSIAYHLAALPKTNLDDIRRVYSHTRCFEQCRDFLQNYPEWIMCPYFSIAHSAARVREENRHDIAAITSSLAAQVYDLSILVPRIYHNRADYTRFFLVAPGKTVTQSGDKMSLVAMTKENPHRLYRILAEAQEQGLAVTYFETELLPSPGAWSFHMDLTGDLTGPAVRNCIDSLEKNTSLLRLLGTYWRDIPATSMV